MTTQTPYRRALSKEEAIREICKMRHQFDGDRQGVHYQGSEIEDEVADSNPSETDSEF